MPQPLPDPWLDSPSQPLFSGHSLRALNQVSYLMGTEGGLWKLNVNTSLCLYCQLSLLFLDPILIWGQLMKWTPPRVQIVSRRQEDPSALSVSSVPSTSLSFLFSGDIGIMFACIAPLNLFSLPTQKEKRFLWNLPSIVCFFPCGLMVIERHTFLPKRTLILFTFFF